MLLDRTIDLCAEILYAPRSESISTSLSPNRETEEGRGKRKIRIRVCTFLKEAIFIASAFLGAAYRFPFLVVEEDEAGRFAFCFVVFIPFTLP